MVAYYLHIFITICCGFALIVFAALELWHGLNPSAALPLRERFNSVLQVVGLLTIAVVALELGQTVLEEEVNAESAGQRTHARAAILVAVHGSGRRSTLNRMSGDRLRTCS